MPKPPKRIYYSRAAALIEGKLCRASEEEQLQVACVDWFKWNYPGKVIFAIPNGGKRSPMAGQKLKKAGMLPGVPDLFVCVPTGKFGGLFVEMKVKTNVPSDVQVYVMKQLLGSGYAVEVCYTFERFKEVVEDYMGAK